jgi:hypothetical protein
MSWALSVVSTVAMVKSTLVQAKKPKTASDGHKLNERRDSFIPMFGLAVQSFLVRSYSRCHSASQSVL